MEKGGGDKLGVNEEQGNLEEKSSRVQLNSVLPRPCLQGAAPCPFLVMPCPF